MKWSECVGRLGGAGGRQGQPWQLGRLWHVVVQTGRHCCRTNAAPGQPARERAVPSPESPIQNRVLLKGIVTIRDSPPTST